MAANAEIKGTHGFTAPLTQGLMKPSNPDMYDTNMPRMYPIHRHIYIHSVAKRDFDVKHVYYRGTLKGCKNGERYVTCYAVPDPPQQISVDAERGGKRVEVEPRDEAGWRVAIDILNPNNPSTNPYLKLDAKSAAFYSIGKDVDLIKFGLFPSLNIEPKEEELLRAEEARDKAYDELIQEAFQEQSSNPQGFRLWLRSHPDVFDAAEALGVEADFLVKKAVAKFACPNCGDSIKTGIAFHKGSAGVLCVLDWRRAYEAGAVKKEDVPPGKRWQGFGKVETA
jgi:hypothetical protein